MATLAAISAGVSRVLVQSVETLVQPRRDAGRRSARAKRSTCGKRVIGRMPGTIGAWMPAAAQRSRKRRNTSRVVEELRDRTRRAGVDLALEVVEIGMPPSAPRVHFRIRRDRNLEGRERRQSRDQVRGIGEAVRVRRVAAPRPAADRRAARPGDGSPGPSSRARCRGSRRALAPMHVRCGAPVSAVSLLDAA